MHRLTPEEKAAITLQRLYRGHRDRTHFQIKGLSSSEEVSYPAFPLGNDPEIKLKKQDNKGAVAIIATSGVRSVLLACQLGDKHNKKIIPKIILVDNSREVHQFWNQIKTFAEENMTEDDFLKNLPKFFEKNKSLIRDGIDP